VDKLQVHSFLPLTFANGPGARCCLWLQGCSLNCSGCFNPETHETTKENGYEIEEVFTWISHAQGIQGLTISGGEPLQQPDGLIMLLEQIRAKTDLSVIVFTGFSHEELASMPCFSQLKTLVDVLIVGRYVEDAHVGVTFGGCANKSIHLFSDRYSREDLNLVPVSEVIISQNGDLAFTGVDPVRLRKA
jgi:anaerobic ribonucleoside-triphosphate reductase activating protein